MAGAGGEKKTGVLFVCLGTPVVHQYRVLLFIMSKHFNFRCTQDAFRTAGADSRQASHTLVAGNICRSPTAEAVFKAVVDRKGISHLFDVDSCGTGGGVRNW